MTAAVAVGTVQQEVEKWRELEDQLNNADEFSSLEEIDESVGDSLGES